MALAYRTRALLLATLLWSSPSQGQEILLTGPLAGAPAVRKNPAAETAQGFVVPSGLLEVGGGLLFITSQLGPANQPLEFTDVGIARLQVRRSFGDRAEVILASDVLAKQPHGMGEPVWQSASLASTIALGREVGFSQTLVAGQMLGRAGYWYSWSPALLYRPKLHNRWLHFELQLGNSVSELDYAALHQGHFWFDELLSGAQVQMGAEEGGCWIGFDYALPLAHARGAKAPVALDPPVRLGVEFGAVWRPPQTAWDLFASYQIADRGEPDDPTTTLPILTGGFDQRQTLFGVQYQFDERR